MTEKAKIVLDADVIIHFMKADMFSNLLRIFPNYQLILLDVVYNEITKVKITTREIDNFLLHFPSNIQKINFSPARKYYKEYASLIQTLGKGESACMIYCLENRNVLGSSNLKDIKEYCSHYQITYLTTIDFLYYAYIHKVMTKEECDQFIDTVIKKGSKLPKTDISTYLCKVIL